MPKDDWKRIRDRKVANIAWMREEDESAATADQWIEENEPKEEVAKTTKAKKKKARKPKAKKKSNAPPHRPFISETGFPKHEYIEQPDGSFKSPVYSYKLKKTD